MRKNYESPRQTALELTAGAPLLTSLPAKDASHDFNKDNNESDWLSKEKTNDNLFWDEE